MKKLYFVLIAIAFFGLTAMVSCKSTEKPAEEPVEEVIEEVEEAEEEVEEVVEEEEGQE